jgi:hypothetical protein
MTLMTVAALLQRSRIWWRSRVQRRYWVTVESESTAGEFHVIPNRDLIHHDKEYGDCVCIPRTEAQQRDDGSYGWIVTHHSLDGRELDEVTR